MFAWDWDWLIRKFWDFDDIILTFFCGMFIYGFFYSCLFIIGLTGVIIGLDFCWFTTGLLFWFITDFCYGWIIFVCDFDCINFEDVSFVLDWII